jgi:hypothetical protein
MAEEGGGGRDSRGGAEGVSPFLKLRMKRPNAAGMAGILKDGILPPATQNSISVSRQKVTAVLWVRYRDKNVWYKRTCTKVKLGTGSTQLGLKTMSRAVNLNTYLVVIFSAIVWKYFYVSTVMSDVIVVFVHIITLHYITS